MFLTLQLTAGYSGSDIKLVCKEAAMRPIRKVFDKLESIEGANSTELEGVTVEPITTEDVKAALSRTKPSAKLLAEKYVKWEREYESV